MTRPTTAALALCLAVLAAPAWSQAIDEDQLASLRDDLLAVSDRVKGSIAATQESGQALGNFSGDARTEAAFQILDAVETETRTVLDQVRLNSPFMDELDRARAEVVTILRKHEREPTSPARDARVARLTTALSEVERQYEEIQNAESRMTRLLSDHALMRREIVLNGEVGNVETFVDDLAALTAGLDEMATVLAEVARTTIAIPDAPVIGQE